MDYYGWMVNLSNVVIMNIKNGKFGRKNCF